MVTPYALNRETRFIQQILLLLFATESLPEKVFEPAADIAFIRQGWKRYFTVSKAQGDLLAGCIQK